MMCTLPVVVQLVLSPRKASNLPPPSPLPGLCEPGTSLGTPGAAGGAGGQPPGNLAGRLLRTAAVHRVQAGGAGRLPNRRTLYPAPGRLHTKNSCRPGPGSATRPRLRPRLWGMLRENYCPADKMAEAVTADEASILQVGVPIKPIPGHLTHRCPIFRTSLPCKQTSTALRSWCGCRALEGSLWRQSRQMGAGQCTPLPVERERPKSRLPLFPQPSSRLQPALPLPREMCPSSRELPTLIDQTLQRSSCNAGCLRFPSMSDKRSLRELDRLMSAGNRLL